MAKDTSVFMIIKPRPPKVLVAEIETQRFDEVQFGPGVGAKTNDIAGIRRNFRLIENDS